MYAKMIIDKKSTGEKIKLKIKEKGISLENLAILLELESPRVIYEWIRGNKKPSLETAYNLSIVLETKIEDLIVFVPMVHC